MVVLTLAYLKIFVNCPELARPLNLPESPLTL